MFGGSQAFFSIRGVRVRACAWLHACVMSACTWACELCVHTCVCVCLCIHMHAVGLCVHLCSRDRVCVSVHVQESALSRWAGPAPRKEVIPAVPPHPVSLEQLVDVGD